MVLCVLSEGSVQKGKQDILVLFAAEDTFEDEIILGVKQVVHPNQLQSSIIIIIP